MFAKWHILVKKPDSTIVNYNVSQSGKVENIKTQRQSKRNIKQEIQAYSSKNKGSSSSYQTEPNYNYTQESNNYAQENNNYGQGFNSNSYGMDPEFENDPFRNPFEFDLFDNMNSQWEPCGF